MDSRATGSFLFRYQRIEAQSRMIPALFHLQFLLGMFVKLLPLQQKVLSSVQFFMDGKAPEKLFLLQEGGGGNNLGGQSENGSAKRT